MFAVETAMRNKYVGFGPWPRSVPRPRRRKVAKVKTKPEPKVYPEDRDSVWKYAEPGSYAATYYQGRFQFSEIVGHNEGGEVVISYGPTKFERAAIKPAWIIEHDGKWLHVESGGKVATHGEALLISMCENLR
jgi:hypothetical protein